MKLSFPRSFWPILSLSLALTTTAKPQTPPKPGEAVLNAIRKGDLPTLKTIIETDVTLVNSGARGSTPLFEAIQNGKPEIVSYLLDKGADPNQETYSQAPLGAALQNYNDWKAMSDALAAKGAKVNYTDNEGQTPLMRILMYGGNSQKDKIVWLIAHGADLNLRSRFGISALDMAIANSPADVVTQLLAASDIKKADDNGNTPLFTAVSSGKVEYAKLLLDKGADINVQNGVGDTVLHVAAARPNGMLVTLLGAGAKTDIRNHRGDLALHVALRRASENVISPPPGFVYGYNLRSVRPTASDSESATPRGTLIQPLTDKSDINARDQLGLSPLLLALEYRDQESRDLIMARAPKMDATMKLFDAVSQGDTATVKTLLTQKPYLVYFRLADGTTPLHISALWGTLGVAQLLVQKGADVTARDAQGQIPLHEALTRPTGLFVRRAKNMVTYLLEKGANAGALDTNDTTPLHRAVFTGNTELVTAILAKKVNVDERDKSGQTPLFTLMTKTGDIGIIKMLFDQGASANIRNASGTTLLSRAVLTRRPELVSLLLDKGADAIVKSSEGNTALASMINNGGGDASAEIVTLLLAKGADPNERLYGDPLINRAIGNDAKEVVRALLATKKVNLKAGNDRQSPLMQAVSYGRTEMVGMLLDAGADPNEKDGQGRPLLKIAGERSKELGDLLRAKGAKDE